MSNKTTLAAQRSIQRTDAVGGRHKVEWIPKAKLPAFQVLHHRLVQKHGERGARALLGGSGRVWDDLKHGRRLSAAMGKRLLDLYNKEFGQ